MSIISLRKAVIEQFHRHIPVKYQWTEERYTEATFGQAGQVSWVTYNNELSRC